MNSVSCLKNGVILSVLPLPNLRIFTAFLCILLLSACTTTGSKVSKVQNFRVEDNSTPKFVLMPLDVELSILTASGLQEPQAEWTENAIGHIKHAVELELSQRNVGMELYKSNETDPASTLVQLQKVHEVLGYSVLVHHLGQFKLPSKKGDFDWTLGSDVSYLKEKTGADYAMFIFMRDSYSSAGRVAVQVFSALLGVGVTGGVQVGFASVVDLNSGEIVWFNRLVSTSNDLRDTGGAENSIKGLLKTLPSV